MWYWSAKIYKMILTYQINSLHIFFLLSALGQKFCSNLYIQNTPKKGVHVRVWFICKHFKLSQRLQLISNFQDYIQSHIFKLHEPVFIQFRTTLNDFIKDRTSFKWIGLKLETSWLHRICHTLSKLQNYWTEISKTN